MIDLQKDTKRRTGPRKEPLRRARRVFDVALLAAAVMAVSGCAEADRDPAPDTLDVPLYRAEEDLRIGSVEGDDPDGFGSVSGLAIDASERLFVVDIQAHEIRVFDEAGDHLFTAGGAGSGPGELTSPCCPGVAPDGLLWVIDNGNGRYVAFEVGEDGPQGVATRRMSHSDVNRHVRTTFSSEGVPIDIGARPDPATGQRRTVMFHLGEEGGVIREIRAPLPPDSEELWFPVQMMEGAVTRFFYQPFGPRYVVSFGHEVRWYPPDGDGVQVLSDPDAVGPLLTPAQRTRADAMVSADEQIAGTAMPFEVADRHPVIAALYFDDEGHLWVERTASPGEPRIVDVYDFSGELLRRVEIPAEINLTYGVMQSDQLLGVVRDDLGVQYVVRMRLEEADL